MGIQKSISGSTRFEAIERQLNDFDFSAVSVGEDGRNPDWLRSILTHVLASPHPSVLFAGSDLACLFNQVFSDLLGHERPRRSHLLGRSLFRFLRSRSAGVLDLFQRALAGEAGHLAEVAISVRRPGGATRLWFTVTAMPLYDPDGQVIGIHCWGQDITRHFARDHPVCSVGRAVGELCTVFERSPAFVAMLNGPQHVVEMANASMRRLAQNRPLIGLPFVDALPEIRCQDFDRLLDRVWCTGRPLSVRARPVSIGSGAERKTRYLTLVIQPLKDGSGRVQGLFIQGNDVTEGVLAQQREQLANARNAHFAAVVTASADAMVSFDLDGKILTWNPAAERIYGYTVEQAVGRSVSMVIPTELQRELRDCISRVKAGELYSLESMRQRKTGEQFRAAISIAPILDPQGQVVAVSAMSRDITETHQVQQALLESEARFRSIADQVPVMMWLTGVDGRIGYISRQWLLFLSHGRPPGLDSEWPEADDQWLNYVHPNDQERVASTFWQAHAKQATYRVEYRMRRGDGKWRWMLDTALPRQGPDGLFLGLGGATIDITYLRESERARAAINEQFRMLVNLTPTIVWEAAADGQLTKISDRWFKFSGQSSAGSVGDAWQAALHPEDTPTLYQAWEGHDGGDGLIEQEVRLRRHDGVYRWFLIRAAALHGFEGELSGWIGVTNDIHDRKMAEVALREENVTLEARVAEVTAEREQAQLALLQAQKTEALGQMTGGVAHDFNNLLQAITNCLAMIEIRVPDNPQLRPILDAGCQAVERGAKLVQQLMAFARRQALHPQSVDLRDRVLAMSDLMSRSVRADVALEIALVKGLWPVEVDTTQLELAILNLVVNARDAMPEGGNLRIAACNVMLPEDALSKVEQGAELVGRFVRVSVSDTGTGMTREVLERAFDPYYTTKEVGKGSGLGLSQVFGFARHSGGAVWIDSAEGQGTTMHVILRHSTLPPVAMERALPVVLAGGCVRTARVLVVEDDPIVAMTVASALEDAGFDVRQAITADEALPIVKAGRIDLVFSDIVMPGRMNGIDLATEIRCLAPDLPVVLATGYSENVVRIEGVRVIPKPYRIDQLLGVLDSVLERVPEN